MRKLTLPALPALLICAAPAAADIPAPPQPPKHDRKADLVIEVDAGAERLAREACQIEIELCGKPIGKQDQYIAAYGGLQYIQFNPDESVYVDPIICPPSVRKQLQERFLLLYTGLTRSADKILKEQQRNTQEDESRRQMLRAMTQLAGELRDSLYRGDLLAGFFVDDSPAFDEWLERERTALRSEAFRAAHAMSEEAGRNRDGVAAVAYARRAFELACDDEGALRHLLQCLDHAGDRVGAIQTYDVYARRVSDEYDATPAPKLVVAVGDCGCDGGIFGESYASCGAVAKVIPVDVAVPGCPPPPVDILRGILGAVRRASGRRNSPASR